METRDQLIEQAVAAQQRVMQAAQQASAADWQGLDLTMAQLKTLLTLVRRGPSPIGQVAEALGVSLPNASHLVDRLVHAGFVERAEDPADRRRTLARLTPAGDELVLRLRQGHDRFQAWLGRLDVADLAAYVRGVQALARAAEADADIRPVVEEEAREPAAAAGNGRREGSSDPWGSAGSGC
ncbi:MAG TPA: MarR family transcriptional regulator [Thermomicrobiaceae bacterium]|nr:MarR family transcriptional regulator [Thermomicrobiaceae bacterium]